MGASTKGSQGGTPLEKYTEMFSGDILAIDEEIGALDGLFDEITGMIAEMRRTARSDRRGTPLSFISNMFENATSVRSSRISLLKERVHIRKVIADLALKEEAGAEEGAESFRGIARELMELARRETDARACAPAAEEEEETTAGEADVREIARRAYAEETGREFEVEPEEAEIAYGIDQDGRTWLMEVSEGEDGEPAYSIAEEVEDPSEFVIRRDRNGDFVSGRHKATGLELIVIDTTEE